MSFNLLDVLAVQQSQAPEAARTARDKRSAESSKPDKPFREYLSDAASDSKKESRESDGVSGKSDSKNIPLASPVSGDALGAIKDILAQAQGDESTFEIFNKILAVGQGKQQISVADINNNDALSELGALVDVLQASGVSVDENNPFATLLSISKGGLSEPEVTIKLQNLFNEYDVSSVSELVNKVAENILGANGADQQSIQNFVNSVTRNGSEVVNELDVSDKISDVIKQIAQGVIDDAKQQAEEAQLNKGELKSDQILAALGGLKDNAAVNQQQGGSQQLKNKENKASDALIKKLDSDLTDETLANNKIVQNNKQGKNNLDTLFNAVEHVADESKDKLSDLASKVDANKPADSSVGDFIKFQKVVDKVVAADSGQQNNQQAKSEDVMAQIKFGVSALSGKNDGRITIQLSPKELGSVDVKMEVGHDGKTRVAVLAEKADTMNLLQKDSSSLKALLQDALQTSSANLSFSFHDNDADQQWKQFFDENGAPSYGALDDIENKIPEVFGSPFYQSGMIATEGLDIRV